MQIAIFDPQVSSAIILGDGKTVALSGFERDGFAGFGLHFDDADALGAFGLAVVEEARRLLREQEEVPAGRGEEAP